MFSSDKMPVQATVSSVWWFCILVSLVCYVVMQWTKLGRWSEFGLHWVLWSGTPCSLTKLCEYIWIGKIEGTAGRVSAFWTTAALMLRENPVIYLSRSSFTVQIKLCILSGYSTEYKFQIPFYMSLSESGNLFFSVLRILFSWNQKQEVGIAVL